MSDRIRRSIDWDKIAKAGFFKDSVAEQEGVTAKKDKLKLEEKTMSLFAYEDTDIYESRD